MVVFLFTIITWGFLGTWDFSAQFSEFRSHTHLKLHTGSAHVILVLVCVFDSSLVLSRQTKKHI